MENIRHLLKQELSKRIAKNPSYSLRAFANQLEMSHTTLSRILSAKRNLSSTAIDSITKKLGLSPVEAEAFKSNNKTDTIHPYFLIQQDNFSAISEWYFDTILELSLIKKFDLKPAKIAKALNISELQAKLALETLERLDLLKKNNRGKYILQEKNTTNELDLDFTNAAKKKYQKSILEKSSKALEDLPRTKRDHTSTTMAIDSADLPKVKELIQKFRKELNKYLQRDDVNPDQVYQLQVSFFPLTNIEKDI